MRTREEIHNADWFGTIPDGWEMKPLKALFTFSKGMTVTKADLVDDGSRVINYGQVHSKANDGTRVTPELIRNIPPNKVPSNAKTAEAGSFIFACTSEDLQGCGDCIYLNTETGAYAGGDTILLSPIDGNKDNKYLAYQFLTDEWRYQLRRDLVDVKVFHVNGSNLKETYVVLPPAEIRRSIVSYLDARCAPIDEAIARHRAAIGKLEEYRRAVIAHTVAGKVNGLNPSCWGWKRFKFIAHVDSNLVKPDGYENWLHVSPDAIGKGDGRLLHRRTVSEDGVISGNHLFHKGAILYSKVRPRLNKVVIAPDDGLCSADMYPISTNQVTEWLRYYMLSDQFVEQAGLVSDIRIKMPKINQQELGDLKILVPSYEEQLDIVSHLDYQCAAVDDAIDRQHRIIARLEEYRRSLIHAAVAACIDCTKETL